MARWIESWLPGSPTGSGSEPGHPGKRFGLPATGHFSVAGIGRRIAGVFVDWAISYLLVLAVLGLDAIGSGEFSTWVLAIWFGITAVLVGVLGASPGHLALGMRVARTDMARHVGIPRAVLRTAMIAVVIPVFFIDSDGRGWHDRASRTIVVRVLPA